MFVGIAVCIRSGSWLPTQCNNSRSPCPLPSILRENSVPKITKIASKTPPTFDWFYFGSTLVLSPNGSDAMIRRVVFQIAALSSPR